MRRDLPRPVKGGTDASTTVASGNARILVVVTLALLINLLAGRFTGEHHHPYPPSLASPNLMCASSCRIIPRMLNSPQLSAIFPPTTR